MTKPLNAYPIYDDLKALVNEVTKEIERQHDGEATSCFSDDEATEVEYRERSGFIPCTNGGATSWAFVSCDALDGHKGLPVSLQIRCTKEMEQNFQDAIQVYLDNKMTCRGDKYLITAFEQAQGCYEDFTEEQREEFYEYEAAQYREFEWGIQCGVLYHADREDSLYFFLAVNIDAPYYRDNGHFYSTSGHKARVEWLIHEESISLAELMEMPGTERGKILAGIQLRLENALFTEQLDKPGY